MDGLFDSIKDTPRWFIVLLVIGLLSAVVRLGKSWLDRAEGSFKGQHDLRNTVQKLELRLKQVETDLAAHLEQSEPLMVEFAVLKHDVVNLAALIRQGHEDRRVDQEETRRLVQGLLARVDDIRDRLFDRLQERPNAKGKRE